MLAWARAPKGENLKTWKPNSGYDHGYILLSVWMLQLLNYAQLKEIYDVPVIELGFNSLIIRFSNIILILVI